MTLEAYHVICAVIIGAVMGSFMNVVIYRLPRGLSVAKGRSKCPGCKKTVTARDNVPLIGWLLLRGKCRRCGWRIPFRYPLVELLSALSAGLVINHFGLTLEGVWIWSFIAIMLMITFIDWEHQIIPDPLSLGGVVLGWIGSVICLPIGFIQSVVGSLVGAGVMLAIAVAYKAVRKVHGMGGGDVKLMAMVGAFLGWQMVFPVLFAGALFGSVYGIYLLQGSQGHDKTAVAFGSFLAPAACLMMFAGPRLLALYLGSIPR